MLSRSRYYWNHYQKLGVGFRSSQSDIKNAYRALAKKYHPDQNPNDPKAEKMFRDVKEAYECLSNKVSRAEYDRELIQSGRPPWNPVKGNDTKETNPEDDSPTLSRGQLVLVYGFVFVLPFLSSSLRESSASRKISQGEPRKEADWGIPEHIPQPSPRDELTRAFYNPLSHRWERLDDHSDPPEPLDLFKFTVKERPGSYKELLRTNKLRIPTDKDKFSIHRVPVRITQQPLMIRDIASGDYVYNELA